VGRQANGGAALEVIDKALKSMCDSPRDVTEMGDLHPDIGLRLYETKAGPVIVLFNPHHCRISMGKVAKAARLADARKIDAVSALQEVLLRPNVRFIIQNRLETRTLCMLGMVAVTGLRERMNSTAMECFGKPLKKLRPEQRVIIGLAYEERLTYPTDAKAWERDRSWLQIMFRGTPTILAVVNGPFDKEKAGLQIRQSDRGESGRQGSARVEGRCWSK
jgi:hypothetical protein